VPESATDHEPSAQSYRTKGGSLAHLSVQWIPAELHARLISYCRERNLRQREVVAEALKRLLDDAAPVEPATDQP